MTPTLGWSRTGTCTLTATLMGLSLVISTILRSFPSPPPLPPPPPPLTFPRPPLPFESESNEHIIHFFPSVFTLISTGEKNLKTRWFFSFFVRLTANVILMIYTKNSPVWLTVFLTIENFPVGLKIDLYYWMRSNADRFSFRKLNCANKIKNEDFAWKLSNPCCDNDAHESFDTVWIVYWRTRWMCIIEPSKFMHLIFTGIQFRDALALNLRLVVRLKLIIMISKTALHILSMFISTSDGDDQQLIKRRYIVKRFIGSY